MECSIICLDGGWTCYARGVRGILFGLEYGWYLPVDRYGVFIAKLRAVFYAIHYIELLRVHKSLTKYLLCGCIETAWSSLAS